MRIGILTGGGDVPGLNPCIKAVVNRVAHEGHEVDRPAPRLGRRCSSTTRTIPARRRELLPAARPERRAHDRPHRRHVPPHLAHQPEPRAAEGRARASSRTASTGDGPFDFTDHALRVIESLGIDVLIPIGGDDTLSYALRMHDEGVPRRRDPEDDGQRRPRHRLLHRLLHRGHPRRAVHPPAAHVSTGSHERIAVVELFGRYSGETSLITAYLAGVDRAIISEVPFDIDRLASC